MSLIKHRGIIKYIPHKIPTSIQGLIIPYDQYLERIDKCGLKLWSVYYICKSDNNTYFIRNTTLIRLDPKESFNTCLIDIIKEPNFVGFTDTHMMSDLDSNFHIFNC